MATVLFSCSKEDLGEFQSGQNNLHKLNTETLINKIKIDGSSILSNRLGQQNLRIRDNSQVMVEEAYILHLSSGFETVVVPVRDTITNEYYLVILGSEIDDETIFPVLESDSGNISFFNLNERVLFNQGSTSLEDVVDGPPEEGCWVFDGECCYYPCIAGGSSGGNSDDNNDNDDYQGDNTNGYVGSTGENDNNGETIEQTVIISYTTEQIILELEDCTGKTVSEMNTHLPLTSDQSEFLTALLLENINYYNYEINALGSGGLPVQNVPTFEELQGVIENLNPSDFPELIEGIVDYLQFYNNYGPSARGAQPNWVMAVGCFASGIFNAELNTEMLNHKASMSAEELEIFNVLSVMNQWQYLLSAAQARTAAQELFPFAVPKDCTLLNGPGDAFRHAIWNALCKYRLGWFTAQALTSAHENRPYNYEFQQFEVDMDLFNNEVGLSIDGDNYVSIYQAVLNSFNNGELRMLSNREMIGNLCRATSSSSLIIAN